MIWPLVFATVPPNLAAYALLRDDRIELSGTEQTVESDDGLFLVHWTDFGADAPAGGEFAGRPDHVWAVLQGLTLGSIAFDGRGYRTLTPDTGAGGSAQIDVYIRDIDANGYAYPQAAAEGVDGSSCYVEVHAGLEDPEVIASVTAHEIHHCVQYRYTTEANGWIYEATATYEQYLLADDPVLDLAAGVLWVTRLAAPERPLSARGNRYEYAGLTVLKFQNELGGHDPSRSIALWERLEEEPDWRDALELEAGANWDMSLDEWFMEYSTWNAFACSRDDGLHYGPDVGCEVETSVPTIDVPSEGGVFAVDLQQIPLSAAYAQLPAGGDDAGVALGCDAPGLDGELRVRALALDADGLEVDSEQERTIDDERLTVALPTLPPDGSALFVFGNTGQIGTQVECEVERVTAPIVETGCGCSSTGSTGWLALFPALWLRRRRQPS